MYQIHDTVMHPTSGVCTIEEIKEMRFGFGESKLYYLLKPVYDQQASIIYVPVDTDKVHFRKLLSKEDICDMIHEISFEAPLWVENNAARKEAFSRILAEGDQKKLVQLIAELHLKKIEILKTNHKFHVADERVLQEAEKRIHQEFAYALSLKLDEVAPFIMQELRCLPDEQ